jgi:hypothetical protein
VIGESKSRKNWGFLGSLYEFITMVKARSKSNRLTLRLQYEHSPVDGTNIEEKNYSRKSLEHLRKALFERITKFPAIQLSFSSRFDFQGSAPLCPHKTAVRGSCPQPGQGARVIVMAIGWCQRYQGTTKLVMFRIEASCGEGSVSPIQAIHGHAISILST